MEAFIREDTGAGFNQVILDKRIGELSFKKEPPRYNLEWEAGMGSKVVPIESPTGRFINLQLIPDEKANQKFYRDGKWWPQSPTFAMHSSDPFNYSETEGKRKSFGAIVGIKRRIRSQEREDEDIRQWRVPDILYTYANRTATVDLFAEDCLKVTLYYGGLHNTEVNNERVRALFIQWGYREFLYHFRDDLGGYRKTAGFTKTGNTGDNMISLAAKFIEHHGHRLNHLELLKQCKEFVSVEDITNLDLLAAFSGACLAIENDYRSGEIMATATVTYRELFGQR